MAIPISEISLPCEPVCRQITISGMQLKQTLAALKPHVDSPWSNVRLSGKKGGLVIEAIGVKTLVATRVTLNGEGEAGFDLHLPLRDLLGVVQSVKKKERVTLALENQGLRLGLEAMSTVLSPVLNPDDAPVYPSMAEQSERIATLPLDASAFEYTLAAMSTDYSRPNIEVLHFEPEADDKPAFVVSTDGHRLHEADLPGATICKPFSLWGAAAELVQRLQKATGDTQAEAYRDDKGVMQVQAPGWEIRCTAEEHLFPDFRRVLPSRSLLPISVTIPLEPFRKALKAMKKVAVVEVNVNGAIDLTWSDRSSGSSGKATLPQLDHIGPDVIGGFNPSYMLAAFETESERGIWQFPALTKDAEGVTISEGVLGPTLFRSEAGDRRAVLMPCRL